MFILFCCIMFCKKLHKRSQEKTSQTLLAVLITTKVEKAQKQ